MSSRQRLGQPDRPTAATPRERPACSRPEVSVLGEMAGLAAGLLVLSLLLFSRLGTGTFAVALGIATLSALYSLPPFDWKGRPLLSSAAHLAGGALHFLLGYCVAGAIDRRGLVMATFFGVTFAAGSTTRSSATTTPTSGTPSGPTR